MEQTPRETKWKSELFDWLKSFVLIGAITAFIYVFIMAPYIVKGSSMESTLHDRERVIVNKAIYYLQDPKPGDIVIVHPDTSGDNWIKRVIAVAGDTVEAKGDQLYVNGQPLEEDYLSENKRKAAEGGYTLTDDFGPVKVEEGSVFVMGDNRVKSWDSRMIGPVKIDTVVGRAEAVYWPLSSIRLPK
jgi:signal peptidase I